MPTNRTPIVRPIQTRVTPEAVELYRLILEIHESGQGDMWEIEGGRYREMLNAEIALMHALQLKPWDYLPVNVPLDGQPRSWEDPERFALAQSLRQALEAALDETT